MTKVVYLERPFVLKPYSKKELSNLLQITPHVLRSWLKSLQPDLGEPIAGLFTIRQVEFIIDAFGIPGQIVNQAA
jgi:hypothetical protein